MRDRQADPPATDYPSPAPINRRVWVAFHERVVPDTEVDLVIDTDTESIDSVVRTIVTALVRW